MKIFAYFQRARTNEYTPSLFDQNTFYPAFHRSLRRVQRELIIESPFLTAKRVRRQLPELKRLIDSGVNVIINTRDPIEHGSYMRSEAELALVLLHDINATILFTGGLHRKLAIIDRSLVWEGSLNILSQNDSCEIMHSVESKSYALKILGFINIERIINEK